MKIKIKIQNLCSAGGFLTGWYAQYLPGLWPKIIFLLGFGVIFIVIAVKADAWED